MTDKLALPLVAVLLISSADAIRLRFLLGSSKKKKKKVEAGGKFGIPSGT